MEREKGGGVGSGIFGAVLRLQGVVENSYSEKRE